MATVGFTCFAGGSVCCLGKAKFRQFTGLSQHCLSVFAKCHIHSGRSSSLRLSLMSPEHEYSALHAQSPRSPGMCGRLSRPTMVLVPWISLLHFMLQCCPFACLKQYWDLRLVLMLTFSDYLPLKWLWLVKIPPQCIFFLCSDANKVRLPHKA